jgi:hypothetical protein
MVNSPDGNLDIPSGKENTSQMTTPLGIMKEMDGNLIQVARHRFNFIQFRFTLTFSPSLSLT